MKILIDNGHGEETPGKQSPDGRPTSGRMRVWWRNALSSVCV